MRIQTGHGTIPLITLIGIWSISALNALPGLAVSKMKLRYYQIAIRYKNKMHDFHGWGVAAQI